MNEQAFLEKLARDYQSEGYAVITHPDKDHLPAELADFGIDMLAQRSGETAAIRLKSRHQLVDLNDLQGLSERLKSQPGWRLEVIVFPPEGGVEVPRDGAEASIDYISSLVDEARIASAAGAVRAAFLLAWSSAEAAMRSAARRQGIVIDREIPRFVLKTLYSIGVISRDDYDRVERCLHVRNAVMHGFQPAKLEVADVEFLLDFTSRILDPEPAEADA
jgi:hypothetical protein